MLKKQKKFIAFIAFTACAGCAFSQTNVQPLPAQRVSLSAQASVQVVQDLLTLSLSTSHEGPDAQAVQSQLKAALDAALVLAKKDAAAPLMTVRTGRFGLAPRYTREGKISGWQGTAELILAGQDMARISQTAGRISTLSVASASFGLTPAQRQAAQAQAQSQAIALFRQRASDIAKAFDFATYTLGEVSVHYDEGPMPGLRAPMMAVRAMAADAAPVPVEAGLAAVLVSVTGSVQLK